MINVESFHPLPRMDHMNRHKQRVHKVALEFSCDTCEFSTSTATALRQHKQAVHPKDEGNSTDKILMVMNIKAWLDFTQVLSRDRIKRLKLEICLLISFSLQTRTSTNASNATTALTGMEAF